MLPENSELNYFQILQHAIVAFLCAFAKEFNDTIHKKESFLLFLTDFILSGVCGSLIGLIAIAYVDNIYISLFIAGAGAFLGSKGLLLITRKLLQKYIDIDIEITTKTENKKRK